MTLRQLLLMCDARLHEQWNRTASLLAMLVNVNRDPRKGRALRPADFHPAHIPAADPPLKADIGLLKSVFVDRS